MEHVGPSLVEALASHGLPGIVIGLLAFWVYLKDKEIREERKARIEDAKAFTDLAMKLQSEVIASVNKLSLVFEETKKIMADRRPGGGYRS